MKDLLSFSLMNTHFNFVVVDEQLSLAAGKTAQL